MKKYIISSLILTLVFSLFYIGEPVSAIDFSGQEDKYMKICSSSNLSTSNYSTCKEFNSYLKKKNKDLKSSISNSKAKLEEISGNMDTLETQIATLNDEIAAKEQEINYLQTSITNLEANIAKKEQEIKDRMYAMQAYNNSNMYVDFIFGAENFADMFSRIDSVNEITEYDNDLIAQLADEKKQVETQKATVETAKANIEEQKQQQVVMQNQYEALFQEQNATLLQQQEEQKSTADAQGKLDATLSLLVQQTQSTSHGVTGDSALGQAIANKALSKQGCMYLWGGCHSMSEISNPGTTRFDCSGLVSWAFYQAGKNIGSNTTGTLVGKGMAISASQLQAGDIILFNASGGGGVCHVGIAINNSQMVHAPQTGSPVQVSDLTTKWRARVNSYRRLY